MAQQCATDGGPVSIGTNQGIRQMHKYDGAESDQVRLGKNKFDRTIQFGRPTDGQGRRGRIFAASCIKRSETV